MSGTWVLVNRLSGATLARSNSQLTLRHKRELIALWLDRASIPHDLRIAFDPLIRVTYKAAA